jgi:hypothetical protein
LRGRVNFWNLSHYCDYSERSISRQFWRAFDRPEFHHRVINQALKTDSVMISAQDASFISKSGKQTFGLGYFFNGCHSRPERGLEISTLALVDVTRLHPGGGPAIARASSLVAGANYHAVDGYFAKKKYIDQVVDLDLHLITKLRSDADCLFVYTSPHPRRRGARRKYDG